MESFYWPKMHLWKWAKKKLFSQETFPNARKHCALRSRFSLEKGGYVFGSGLGAMLCKRGYREGPIVCLGDYSTIPTAVGACIGNNSLALVLFLWFFEVGINNTAHANIKICDMVQTIPLNPREYEIVRAAGAIGVFLLLCKSWKFEPNNGSYFGFWVLCDLSCYVLGELLDFLITTVVSPLHSTCVYRAPIICLHPRWYWALQLSSFRCDVVIDVDYWVAVLSKII